MTRRLLEGRTFYSSGNNGVTALIDKAAQEDFADGISQGKRIYETLMRDKQLVSARHDAITAGLQHFPESEGPYFAFVSTERLERSPWFTGDNFFLAALEAYITAEGGTVEYKGFWVPFSNGYELNLHGEELQTAELRKTATPAQFRATFGIGWREIEARAKIARKAHEERLRQNAGKD